MQKEQSNRLKTLYFSRWSGKAYSVFMSLGKIVKICRLAVGMCSQTMLKLGDAIITEINQQLNTKDVGCKEEVESEMVDLFFMELLCAKKDKNIFVSRLNMKINIRGYISKC